MDMAGELEEILQAERAGAEAQGKLQKKIKALQERIKRGEYTTTGDKVKDFMLAAYGQPEGKIDHIGKTLNETITELSTAIAQNIGQQVLIAHEAYSKWGEDGCFSSSHLARSGRYLRLGVITGELQFDYAEGKVNLPVSRHAVKGSSLRYHFDNEILESDGWNLSEQLLSLDSDDLMLLHQQIRHSGRRHSQALHVFTERDVELYFRLVNSFTDLPTIIEMITDRYHSEKMDSPMLTIQIDVAYVPALQALGLEVPRDFQLQYDRQTPERHQVLFREIYDLGEPEVGTSEAEKLKERLAYALEVGLHQEVLILPGTRKGTSIFSNQVLPALCGYYGVEIPKEQKEKK